MKMLRRTLAVLLTALLVLTAAPLGGFELPDAIAASTQEGFCGEDLTWVLDEDGTLTISGTGAMEFEYYSAPWESTELIKKVVIGEGVTSIADQAFFYCSNLTDVELPDSLVSIGEEAFFGCELLSAVDIPDNVTEIADSTFELCVALASVTLPAGLKKIGSDAFLGCSALSAINIPDSITSIGDEAFFYCTSLTNVQIPEAVASIGTNAFYNCASLTAVDVAENNAAYSSENGVLYNKDRTTLICYPAGKPDATFSIPVSVTEIGYAVDWYATNYAFHFCDALTEIEIPASVTTIQEGEFYGCSALASFDVAESNMNYSSADGILYNKDKTILIRCPESSAIEAVVIPESVTTIADSAFENCSNIQSVSIPDSVTSISSSAFCECTSLKNVDFSDGITEIQDYAFFHCVALESVSLPESIEYIGRSAFGYCRSLTTVEIPASVTDMSLMYGFYGCTALTAVEVDENNPAFCSVDGVVYSKDQTVLLWYPAGKTDPCFVVPDGVTTIADCNGKQLVSVVIPATVETIPVSAFLECIKLTDIYYCGTEDEFNAISFEEDYAAAHTTFFTNAAKHFNYSADVCAHVWECTLTVTPTATEEGEMTRTCLLCDESEKQVVDAITITHAGECGEDLIWTVDSMGTLIISGTGAMSEYEKGILFPDTIKKVIIEEGVETVGYNAFSEYYLIEEVILPSTLSVIREGAFYGCLALSEIVVPDSVVCIEISAFSGQALLHVSYGGSEKQWKETEIHSFNEDFYYGEIQFNCADTCVHTWDDGIVAIAPTDTQAGRKTYICTACGKTKTENMMPLSGEFETSVVPIRPDEEGNIVATAGVTVGELFSLYGTSEIYDKNGEYLSSEDKLGTGATVYYYGMQVLIIVPGDIDGEGEITSSDARSTLRSSVMLDELSYAEAKAADVNGDGEVTSADARSILRASVGLDNPADWLEMI